MKSDHNSSQIFSLALGLVEPWFVEKVHLSEVEDSSPNKELHIHINFHKGHEFVTDDGQKGKGYDTELKTWRHLDFFQHKCFLHARVPRIELADGKVRQISVPWARSGSGFTLLFEAYSMLLIESEMPVNKVADCVKVTAPRLWRVFDYWIERAKAKDDLSNVCEIGIDETSSKKGHNYVTVFADMAQTNGILEGINSKIQLAKRRARGYRNIKNYMNMIFFTCGKLKFDYPRYAL